MIGKKKYYMLSFDYNFTRANDEVYFAYALPYTFSKLYSFVKQIMDEHNLRVRMLEQRLSHVPDSGITKETQKEA